MINRSAKKFAVLFLVFVLSIFSGYKTAEAVLPLLFAELAADAIEGLAIRSVANTTIANVTVAANDTSWFTFVTDWFNVSRAVGNIMLSTNMVGSDANKSVTAVAVQVTSQASDLPKGTDVNTYKLSYPSPTLSSAQALDGVSKSYPSPIVSDSQTVVSVESDVINWHNNLAFTQYAWAVDTSCYQGTHNGLAAWWCPITVGGVSGGNIVFDAYTYEGTDGVGRLLFNGYGWSADQNDPDWTPDQLTEYGSVQSIRVAAADKQSHLDLQMSSDHLNIQYEQQVNSNQYRKLDINTDSLMVPKNYDSGLDYGVISSQPDVVGQLNGGTSTINFPTDYARQGEAANAAFLINSELGPKLDTINHDLTDTGSVDDPTVPTAQDMPWFGSTFDGLTNFTIPGHDSICPQPQVDLSNIFGPGHVYTMDAHCQLLQDHYATLRAAMILCWTIWSLFIILSA